MEQQVAQVSYDPDEDLIVVFWHGCEHRLDQVRAVLLIQELAHTILVAGWTWPGPCAIPGRK